MAVLSDEQTMLRDMARDWTRKESPVKAFRKVRDSNERVGYDPSVLDEMAQMGWAGIVIPEAHGGSDFGWLSLGLVLEELGKTLTAHPINTSMIAASAIMLGGSDAQKAQWLPKITSGELVATFAFDEGPRHDPGAIATTVSGGKLTGTKAFVHEGDSAELFVVAAQDGLYLAAGDDGDVSRSHRSMTDFRSHAEIVFDGAAAEKLADGGDSLVEQVLDRARIITSAEMLGMAGQAFDTTLDFLKQRVQFGQILSTFQALQHRMADLFSKIELMRSAVESAFEALDNVGESGGDVGQQAAIAKAIANDTLHLMSREAIQLHGGIGMTDEYDIGFYIKRARILENSWGNSSYLRSHFASLSGY